MRVLLINPPWQIKSKGNVWRTVAAKMPPLGLAWIATVLDEAGHKVEIIDAHAEGLFVEDVPDRAKQLGDFDIIGITATTPLINNSYALSGLLKNVYPDCLLVLGGVHPTVLPEECLSHDEVDLVVRGEGEMTLLDLANGKDIQKVDGVSWKKDGKIIHNSPRELIKDLDSLPMPLYEKLPMHRYHPAIGASKRLPSTSILATRGCPGRCTFCHRQFGERLRVRSGRKVAEEVLHLQKTYGIKDICFYDDTFTASKKEVRAFCEALQEYKIDLTWNCFSRIDTFNEEVFRMMKQSGCHQVMFGVESLNREILKNINKKMNPDAVKEVIQKAKKLGLEVRAAFMIGNPGETEESLQQMIRDMISLDPDIVHINITTPYPGTEMFSWARHNNLLMTTDWNDYDLSKPVMRVPGLSQETMRYYYKLAYRKFYLRWGYLLNRLRKLNSIDGIKTSLRAFFYMMR